LSAGGVENLKEYAFTRFDERMDGDKEKDILKKNQKARTPFGKGGDVGNSKLPFSVREVEKSVRRKACHSVG